MDNSNTTNCCTPNQESKNNTDCCVPNNNSSNKNFVMKKKFGLGILGLAFIFAFITAFKSSPKAEVSCIKTINTPTLSIADFGWIKTDKKVAYVVLKGNNTSQNKEMTSKVESIVNELNTTEGSAYFIALEAGNANYKDVVSKLKIEKTPSIVVLGKSATKINAKDVNSMNLIRAYDAVLTTKASCTTTKNASCTGESKTSCSPKQKAACSGSKTLN